MRLNGAPAKTFYLPMRSRRSDFLRILTRPPEAKLSSFEASGAPIKTQSVVGAPLSELRPWSNYNGAPLETMGSLRPPYDGASRRDALVYGLGHLG